MKTTQTTIIALLAGLSVIHCGGKENQSESLSALLTSRSAFSIDADNLEEITDGCGGGSGMRTTHTVALGEPVPVAGAIGNSAEEITVSFRSSTFSLRSGGSTILSGTWREIDRNTIEVTINGEKLELDVTLQGDTIVLSLPAATSLDCSGSTDGEDQTMTDPVVSAPVVSTVDEVPLWIRKGTWCYESGYQSADGWIVESLLFFNDSGTSYVRHFSSDDYERVTIEVVSAYDEANHIFEIRALNGGALGQGKFDMTSEDRMTAIYGPYQSVLKWISDETIVCPGGSPS